MSNQKLPLSKDQLVITVETVHCHVPKGLIGTIKEVMADGYAVYYTDTKQQNLFGGGGITKPATVFMRFTDVQPHTPEPPKGTAQATAK